jgi:hypothetical protein
MTTFDLGEYIPTIQRSQHQIVTILIFDYFETDLQMQIESLVHQNTKLPEESLWSIAKQLFKGLSEL